MKTIYIYNFYPPSIQNTEQHHINNLSLIANGSADLILCDCLDSMNLSDRISRMSEIFSKLKINGKVIFKSINLNIFAKHIVEDKLNIENINSILSTINSMVDDNFIDVLLEKHKNMSIIEHINNGLEKTMTIQRLV